MRLEDKIAIVTGGAMGTGQASALRFAQEGAKAAIVNVAGREGRQAEEMLREWEPECACTRLVTPAVSSFPFGVKKILFSLVSSFLDTH
jgi:NAD(P)-dependent dehydrogenase (short-subunit alcohol dehydrogenase family)